MNDDRLSVLERAKLVRRIAKAQEDVKKLESLLKGVPLQAVRFANAVITNALVDNLSADKITSGSISAGEKISINNGQIVLTADYFKIAKAGFNAETAAPKDMIFDSTIPVLKYINNDRYNFTLANGASATYEFTYDCPFPMLPFVYIYVPSLSAYKLVPPDQWPQYFGDFLHASMEYDGTKIYVYVSNFTGGSVSSHLLWYAGYA